MPGRGDTARYGASRDEIGTAFGTGEGLIYRVPGLGYYISHGAAVAPPD